MTSIDGNILLNKITKKAKIFLTQYAKIDYDSIGTIQDGLDKLKLNYCSVIVYVHGKLNFTVFMSFEEDLLKEISHTFIGTDEIEESEKKDIYASGAKETINTILGLAFTDYINQGKISGIIPPIELCNTTITKLEGITAFSKDLTTKFGKLSIKVIDYKEKDI